MKRVKAKRGRSGTGNGTDASGNHNEEVKTRLASLRRLLNSTAFAEAVNAFGVESAQRGRRARHYLADASNIKGVNDTVQKVFATIKSAGADGMTQVQLQESLKLPHSTVWYALVKLRKRHAIKHVAAA